jgi:glutaminase
VSATRAKPKAREVEVDLQELVEDIARRMASETERGAPADYIPELAEADINRFGIAVVPVKGEPVFAGDADMPFSIQSISKVITLTLALEKVGANLWSRVGREPSGDPFNSIVQLEHEHGKPRNPFINSGAIVVTDVVRDGRPPQEALEEIVEFCRHLADDKSIEIDRKVAKSEDRTGSRNRALANFMLAEGNMSDQVEKTLDVYFGHCAIAMSCRQLAMAGRYLASSGYIDGPDHPVVTPDRARRINALMTMCGQYDASGEFAFRVGVPSKSGVGGGMLAIAPGVASVAAWCPGLDDKGNSVLAGKALEELARATGVSVFGPL